MNTAAAELIAVIGLLSLVAIPLGLATYLAERKQRKRSKAMLGKGRAINFRNR